MPVGFRGCVNRQENGQDLERSLHSQGAQGKHDKRSEQRKWVSLMHALGGKNDASTDVIKPRFRILSEVLSVVCDPAPVRTGVNSPGSNCVRVAGLQPRYATEGNASETEIGRAARIVWK